MVNSTGGLTHLFVVILIYNTLCLPLTMTAMHLKQKGTLCPILQPTKTPRQSLASAEGFKSNFKWFL